MNLQERLEILQEELNRQMKYREKVQLEEAKDAIVKENLKDNQNEECWGFNWAHVWDNESQSMVYEK